jgi:hypothetical protein
MFEMRQLCYTMIGKVIPERKASQQSMVRIWRAVHEIQFSRKLQLLVFDQRECKLAKPHMLVLGRDVMSCILIHA